MEQETVIQVSELGKRYRLGVLGGRTLSDDLKVWWAKLRGKPNPLAMVDDKNSQLEEGTLFWALKDISFEVKKGEILGIIGKNGAGKSTLLKLLSQITSPTEGDIKMKGKVASLLEVGTGFHPELTGRENIYLNGAILGMTKGEINKKIDDIIDFSGIKYHIDTPVKRYSSGMKVRLGFAVAAHLEPEILIIDEVLAVGDAEFQKKCLGKMKDVTSEGRTVLFVSHNMTSINSLCDRCLYLKNGKVFASGDTSDIVNLYLSTENTFVTEVTFEEDKRPGNEVAVLHSARVIDEQKNIMSSASVNQSIGIEMEYEVLVEGYLPVPNIHMFTIKSEHVFVSSETSKQELGNVGMHKSIMWIPANLLNQGTYIFNIALSDFTPVKNHFNVKEALSLEVIEDIGERDTDFVKTIPGIIRPKLKWDSVTTN